jgi:hypothetical protein
MLLTRRYTAKATSNRPAGAASHTPTGTLRISRAAPVPKIALPIAPQAARKRTPTTRPMSARS